MKKECEHHWDIQSNCQTIDDRCKKCGEQYIQKKCEHIWYIKKGSDNKCQKCGLKYDGTIYGNLTKK